MARSSQSPTTSLYISLELEKILGRQANPVCGYFSANLSLTFTCPLPNICASSSSFHGCCPPETSCYFPTSCIEFTTLASGCDEACSSNPAILKCLQPYPHCATRYFNEATLLTQFVCDAMSSVTDEIYTTYVNEEISPDTISIISVVGAVTATPTSSTKNTSAILSALSSKSETLPNFPATASATNESTTRISRGAIAGVGVGVLASLLIGMAIIFFYHYYTRRHRSLQLGPGQTSLSAQRQALNASRPDIQVPRTTSNFGWMPRELPISGSVHTQQELPAGGILEMQQIGSFKKHHRARSSKSNLGRMSPGAPASI